MDNYCLVKSVTTRTILIYNNFILVSTKFEHNPHWLKTIAGPAQIMDGHEKVQI